MRQKFDFGMEPKWQHFFPHASRSLLCIRFVAVAVRSEEEVSWRRGPRDLFWPRPGSAWADLAEKQQHLWWTISTSSLPSFIKIHLAVLEEKSKMWKVYGRTTTGDDDDDDDGRTDRRTTDGALWQKLTRALGSGELKIEKNTTK